MTRYLVTLHTASDRQRALKIMNAAPDGTRVEFKASKRSTDQNAKLWAMLTDVATQVKHNDRRLKPEIWKALFCHACGREAEFVRSLDGDGIIPIQRTSDMTKAEMASLLDYIQWWGATNGVTFHDGQEQAGVAA